MAKIMKILITVLVLFLSTFPVTADHEGMTAAGTLKFTVLYDNYPHAERTKADWGFACLIEGTEKTILFDTGGKPDVLMHNLKESGVDLEKVDMIVISHDHWDHTGGLLKVLEKRAAVDVFLPVSFPREFVGKVRGAGARVVSVKESRRLCKDVYLTGEMGGSIKEQSLLVAAPGGWIVVTGCSHPGIVDILERAKEIADRDIFFVFGGFHLLRHEEARIGELISRFRELGVKKCGATHCTGDKAIRLFRQAFGKDYVDIGSGRVLKVSEKGLE